MKEEIKVGQIWIKINEVETKIKIIFVAEQIVVFERLNSEELDQGFISPKGLLFYYTLKNPNQFLKS